MRRGDHQLAHELRVFDRGHERHAATQRVADNVRPVEPEVADQRGDVVGHEPDVEWPIDVGGAPVPLQVGGNDLVVGGKCRPDRPEHLARAEAAMHQDERSPGALGLVVEMEAVDVGIGAGWLGGGGRVSGHRVVPHRVVVLSVHQTTSGQGTHRRRGFHLTASVAYRARVSA